MENLRITVTNKKTGQSDSETALPYYFAARKEQENTLAKEIRDRNNWKENECENYTEIILS